MAEKFVSTSRIILRTLSTLSILNNKYQSVSSAMMKQGIVPDMLDVAPDEELKIIYPTGVKVNLGNLLTPWQVSVKPIVEWEAFKYYYYLLLLVDLDVPSRTNPNLSEFQHWVVGNIPGNCVEEGETLTDYIGAMPEENTGCHRCVFLVYLQSKRIEFQERCLTDNTIKYRERFCAKLLSAKYRLGDPIAGNFFITNWDCFVDDLKEKFGD